MRRIRYQEIADELRRRARAAPPGSVLPSESELSAEFDASRVTVRRALELVRDEGLIAARQGFGWFVAAEPVRQRLERLLTIESQLETSGIGAVRRVIEFEFVKPPAHVTAELGVDRVLRVKRISLADGEPFAVVTVWCPAELGQHLSMADVERRPFYELLDIELRGRDADDRRRSRRTGRRRAARGARRRHRCSSAGASPPTRAGGRC